MIVFFDARALIYLLEGRELFGGRVRTALAALEHDHAGAGADVNRLSWLECRVGRMKADDAATLALFDAFFARPDLIWVELSRDVVELKRSTGAKVLRHAARFSVWAVPNLR